MKTFKESYLENHKEELVSEAEVSLAVIAALLDDEELYENIQSDSINEGETVDKINNWLNKVGLKLKKEEGLIDYVVMFTTGVGKLFLAGIKGDKEKMKKILKGLSKEKVLDFLLKLDMATLHLVTGPIHTIDAITGWDLWATVEHTAKGVEGILKSIKDGIEKVKKSVMKVIDGTNRVKVISALSTVEKNLPPV